MGVIWQLICTRVYGAGKIHLLYREPANPPVVTGEISSIYVNSKQLDARGRSTSRGLTLMQNILSLANQGRADDCQSKQDWLFADFVYVQPCIHICNVVSSLLVKSQAPLPTLAGPSSYSWAR